MKYLIKKHIGEISLYIGILCTVLFANHLYRAQPDTNFEVVQSGNYSDYGVTPEQPIVVYSATWCDACKELKRQLANMKIAYKNYDFDKDKEQFSKLRDRDINVVPVIFIQDTMITGFDHQLLISVLEDNHLSI